MPLQICKSPLRLKSTLSIYIFITSAERAIFNMRKIRNHLDSACMEYNFQFVNIIYVIRLVIVKCSMSIVKYWFLTQNLPIILWNFQNWLEPELWNLEKHFFSSTMWRLLEIWQGKRVKTGLIKYTRQTVLYMIEPNFCFSV